MNCVQYAKPTSFAVARFWERKMGDWRLEEQQVKLALNALTSAETEDRALSAERTLELSNKPYLLYVSQDSFEKAKLLRMLCSTFSVDDVSATPTYRHPFDLIFKRAKTEEWSALLDDFRTFTPFALESKTPH